MDIRCGDGRLDSEFDFGIEPPRLLWQQHLPLGESEIHGEPHTIRLRLHVATERYREWEVFYPLSQLSGQRDAIVAEPYIILPALTFSAPPPGDPPRLETQDIGQIQAWYYPRDRLLVVWECQLHAWVRRTSPLHDKTLHIVWTGLESWLLHQYPETRQLVTPAWDIADHVTDAAWQRFLRRQGYQRWSEQVFLKPVSVWG